LFDGDSLTLRRLYRSPPRLIDAPRTMPIPRTKNCLATCQSISFDERTNESRQEQGATKISESMKQQSTNANRILLPEHFLFCPNHSP
jgi:hypothetical protein